MNEDLSHGPEGFSPAWRDSVLGHGTVHPSCTAEPFGYFWSICSKQMLGGGGVLGLNALPPSLACKSKAELEVGLGFCALDLAPLYLLIPKNA